MHLSPTSKLGYLSFNISKHGKGSSTVIMSLSQAFEFCCKIQAVL